jgi:hypothetical protein
MSESSDNLCVVFSHQYLVFHFKDVYSGIVSNQKQLLVFNRISGIRKTSHSAQKLVITFNPNPSNLKLSTMTSCEDDVSSYFGKIVWLLHRDYFILVLKGLYIFLHAFD